MYTDDKLKAEVVAEARKTGISAGEPGSQPAGVTVIKGEWPGVEVAKGVAAVKRGNVQGHGLGLIAGRVEQGKQDG